MTKKNEKENLLVTEFKKNTNLAFLGCMLFVSLSLVFLNYRARDEIGMIIGTLMTPIFGLAGITYLFMNRSLRWVQMFHYAVSIGLASLFLWAGILGAGENLSFWIFLPSFAPAVIFLTGSKSGIVVCAAFLLATFILEIPIPDSISSSMKARSYLSFLIVAISSLLYEYHREKSEASLKAELKARKEAQEAQAEASRAKSRFLSSISHELRTPLVSVIGACSMLSLRFDGENRAIASVAEDSAVLLHSLVGNILDFNRFEENREVQLQSQPFNVSSTVKRALAIIQRMALAKGLKLGSNFDEITESSSVLGDPGRITQILLNFLSNALKFTDKGSISVNVRQMEQKPGNEVILRFEVKDTGTGVGKQNMDDLFCPFKQFDTGKVAGGTGLGLAVSRGLAEAMNGKVGCNSKVNKGSTFWFEAPFTLVEEEEEIKQIEAQSEQQRDAQTRILLAEDNRHNQFILKLMLKELGFEVDIAHNGREAVKKFKEAKNRNMPYIAVLMDYQMPLLNGVGAAIQIREFETGLMSLRLISGNSAVIQRVPIIALTANVNEEVKNQCTSAGMNDFLSKPVSLPDLDAALSRMTVRQSD